MTFEQLRYFAAVMETGKVTLAAKQENISQPSLTVAIQKLEQELGVELFYHAKRSVKPTEYGQLLYPYAISILRQVSVCREIMTTASDRYHHEIHMAYTATVANGIVPKLLSSFVRQYDEACKIYTDEMPSAKIMVSLKHGENDLAVFSHIEEDQDIIQIPVIQQPLVLIVPKDKIRLGVISDDRELLLNYPFISYRKEYPMYQQINDILAEQELHPETVHYAYSEDAIAQLVSEGLGYAIIAEITNLDRYKIEVLRPEWLTGSRTLYLAWHRERGRGRAAEALLNYTKKYFIDET